MTSLAGSTRGASANERARRRRRDLAHGVTRYHVLQVIPNYLSDPEAFHARLGTEPALCWPRPGPLAGET